MARRPRDDEELPESLILQQFTGIRNTVSRERLAPGELVTAQNIDLDDVGQPRRRRGYVRKAEGHFHSIWGSDRITLGVREGELGQIQPDYSFTELGVNVGPTPLAYVEVDGTVYYSSMSASGKVLPDGSIAEWGAVTSAGTWVSPVVNPTDTLGEVNGRLMGAPPMAEHLLARDGRIYLANGKTLWATELYLYDIVDKTRNFYQFESEITGLGAVSDGFYVSTHEAVYFISGPFVQFKRRKVLPYGAFPGSLVDVEVEMVRPEGNMSNDALLMMTKTGLCAALDSGVCYNITQDRVLFPAAGSVAAMARHQDGVHQYVGVADSKGTPVANTRIGDYVDAEIRRFQGE